MSRCLQHFSLDRSEKTIVLVATSGDTGGAVANGFFGVEGVEVVILYPKDKVSKVQELQLTTLGGNVTTLELHGTFDDCQALAKRAIADADLQKEVFITSANSINVARWLPQQFYYFYALKQWQGEPPVISVPSGNFGNLAVWRSWQIFRACPLPGSSPHATQMTWCRNFLKVANTSQSLPFRHCRTQWTSAIRVILLGY